MPPKKSSSTKTHAKTQGPTKQELEIINNYLAQKPDFTKLIAEAQANPPSPSQRVESEYDRTLRDAVTETRAARAKQASATKSKEVDMSAVPKDKILPEAENTGPSKSSMHLFLRFG